LRLIPDSPIAIAKTTHPAGNLTQVYDRGNGGTSNFDHTYAYDASHSITQSVKIPLVLNIYKRTWQIVWAEQWQYRANLLMYLLFWLVTPVIFLAVWASIATVQGSIQGMTAQDFVSYYLMLLPVTIVTADITIHIFTYKVQDGSLSSELVLPIHPILVRTLTNNIGFKVLQMLVFIPAWLILVLVFQPAFNITPASLGLGVVAVIMGFMVNFFFGTVISCLAFWTTRVYWFDQLVRYAIGSMLSGEFVPLNLLPGVLQSIARFAPYQLSAYFPTQLILNKLSPSEIAFNFGMQVLWLCIFAAIFALQWRGAMKKYSAVGA
jgi:ABC-2 type transport system permease protein